jgi:hypothetical protein
VTKCTDAPRSRCGNTCQRNEHGDHSFALAVASISISTAYSGFLYAGCCTRNKAVLTGRLLNLDGFNHSRLSVFAGKLMSAFIRATKPASCCVLRTAHGEPSTEFADAEQK